MAHGLILDNKEQESGKGFVGKRTDLGRREMREGERKHEGK